MYLFLCTSLCSKHLTHLIPTKVLEGGIIEIIPILQLKKLRQRKLQWFVRGHITSSTASDMNLAPQPLSWDSFALWAAEMYWESPNLGTQNLYLHSQGTQLVLPPSQLWGTLSKLLNLPWWVKWCHPTQTSKRYFHILILGTCEHDLIWKKGLCRWD